MTCSITDVLHDGNGAPVAGAPIMSWPIPSTGLTNSGTPLTAPFPSAVTNGSGGFTVVLPDTSTLVPSTTQFAVRVGSSVYVGSPVAGTFTVAQLIANQGWVSTDGGTLPADAAAGVGLVAQFGQLVVRTIPGPPGPAGPSGSGAGSAATPNSLGTMLSDLPNSGSPVAVTTPRIGAASGVAPLDSNAKLPASALSTSAVILNPSAAQSGSVNITGSFEVNGSPITGGGGGGAPSGAAGGGLTGTYPNPTIATVPDSALPVDVARLSPASQQTGALNISGGATFGQNVVAPNLVADPVTAAGDLLIGSASLGVTNLAGSAVGTTYVMSGSDGSRIETSPRGFPSFYTNGLGAGNLYLTYLTSPIAKTVSTIGMLCYVAQTGATSIILGLYTANAAGDLLALVAQTASNTALLAAANTLYSQPFSSPATYPLVAGQRYALGILGIGWTTSPQLGGLTRPSPNNGLWELAPVMAKASTGISTLPASATGSSLANTTSMPWFYLS